ncbi:amidohydrolase [Actinomadura sp. 7K507]|uniref:amidohydrolase n=1 Tax=Actinomadura sp. 7K507 TaxID=2530365 RepID=UPI00104F733A|nr:amidohydrolase [Actinomadura sp. 7K507]TDC92520.1 amidohydrolase [Actinomadura sp. 7K507]
MEHSPLSRRGLLRGGAGLAAGAAAQPLIHANAWAQDADPSSKAADLVLHNGQILTMDRGFRIVSALAVKAGRIVHAGPDPSVRRLVGRRTQVVNLRGRTVLPGINDSHLHGLRTGLALPPYTVDVGEPAVRSIADAVAAVGEAVRQADQGTWIRGKGWNENAFAEGRPPTRQDLDPVSPDHPVVLLDWSNHVLWVNGKALELAGIDRDTPDPSGGVIVRDSSGEPTGLLRETAMDLVNRHVPPYTEQEQADAVDTAVALLLSHGITSFTEPGIGAEAQRVYARKAGRGALGIRVTALLSRPDDTYPTSADHVREILGGHRPPEDVDPRWFNITGVKLRADGVPIASRTAWMREPYVGGGRGGLVTDGGTDQDKVDELTAMVGLVHRHGMQIGTHATGDAAIDAVTAAYARALRRRPRTHPRHYLIHGDFAWPETLRLLAENRCGVSLNPNIKHLIADSQPDVVGAERAAYQTPYRSALRAGVAVTSASDAPNVAPDWRQGLETMLLREGGSGEVSGPDQIIGVRPALRTYTTAGAWQDHADRWKGALARGMAADLCVLEGTLFDARGRLTHDAHAITDVPVALTVVNGEIAYDAANASQRAPAARAQAAGWARRPDPRQMCAHCS